MYYKSNNSIEGFELNADIHDLARDGAMTEASYNIINETIKDYKNALAEENETSLHATSTHMNYIFFILVIMITIIMIILNFTNPDIVSAEILIAYIIFLVLIIIISSNYFSVNFEPINRIFRIFLGNSGSRNIFQSPGYKAS